MTTPHLRKSIGRSPLRLGFPSHPSRARLLCAFAGSASGLPAPDGGYANGNTAEGTNALFSLTTGSGNTANGYQALFNNTTGTDNTANGFIALY